MLRRLGSGIAALSIALLTTFAVVAFPSTAQALHNGTFSQQELKLVQSGVKAAAPKVAARSAVAGAVCGGTLGIGCVAIAVLGIGLLAYDTREIWLPWVQGRLGEDTQGSGSAVRGTLVLAAPSVQSIKDWRSTNSSGLATNGTYSINANTRLKREALCENPDGSQFITTDEEAVSSSGSTYGESVGICRSGVNNVGRKVLALSYWMATTTTATDWVKTWWWERGSPVTTVETELVCQRPDGSTYSVKVQTASPVDQVKVGHCAEGDVPLRVKTVATTGGVQTPQWDVPLAPWDATSDQEYPLCAGGACTYRIHVDGNPCIAGVEACTHWSYIYREQPTRVECFYGPYSINVANNCLFLERAYDLATGARTVTSANTDGNPDTYTAPAPLPARSPTASPTPTPTGTSSASPSPSSTATTAPEPVAPGQPSTSAPADPAGARCFPQGWAMLNPFEWVYKPIMCAMKDAFVPNSALTTSRLETIRTKLDTKGPGPAIAQVSALVSSVPSGGGCQGPGMTIDLGGSSRTLYLFNACTEPMSTAAGYSYALATVVLVIGGGLSVVRAIASAFGLNVSVGRGARDGE